MFSFLNNIPQVTKNILIINVLMFLFKFFYQSQFGMDPDYLLGAHYFNSPLFRPFQVVTHMFMHGDFFHLFFNMFALVMFGGMLERVWGAKRFFIFYIICGLGAIILYNALGFYEIYNLKNQIEAAGIRIYDVDQHILSYDWNFEEFYPLIDNNSEYKSQILMDYQVRNIIPLIGASGAIFGVLAGYVLLFPNTELMLIFLPIPIKAKYLIGAYIAIEIYYSLINSPGDNVAHLAHVTGALVGALYVLINKKRRTKDFW